MTGKPDHAACDGSGLRPARMRLAAALLLSRGGEAFPTELVDISATGALVRRPPGWTGAPGETWVLDVVFAHALHIHLDATVARICDRHVGFAYSAIPDHQQAPLWELLGGYADTLEAWQDD